MRRICRRKVRVLAATRFIDTEGSTLSAKDKPSSAARTRPGVAHGRWVCVEWEFDGPNDTERLWLDPEPITAVTVTGTAGRCLHCV
jgi:hypothetical protein